MTEAPYAHETTTQAHQDDPVGRPGHYRAGGIECIDAIRAALGRDGFVAYCRGNAIKYHWRALHKGDPVGDMRKAAVYTQWAISALEVDH
ncbi:MAG: DUF3310 domain-containing protein, partial [Deltaproteobacteria bacterium]